MLSSIVTDREREQQNERRGEHPLEWEERRTSTRMGSLSTPKPPSWWACGSGLGLTHWIHFKQLYAEMCLFSRYALSLFLSFSLSRSLSLSLSLSLSPLSRQLVWHTESMINTPTFRLRQLQIKTHAMSTSCPGYTLTVNMLAHFEQCLLGCCWSLTGLIFYLLRVSCCS